MKIQNVGYHDIKRGDFELPSEEQPSILIQCVDPCIEFPKPKCAYPFKEVYQFEFSDVEDKEDMVWPFRIRIEQALEIITILKTARMQECNVVVHCMAGVSRSGAIVEFAVNELGFTDPSTYRNPNKYMLWLMTKLFKYRVK